jgi:hypothetical protein
MYVSSMKTNTDPLAAASTLLEGLKPFTQEETRRCFKGLSSEMDALAEHCANLPVPILEE